MEAPPPHPDPTPSFPCPLGPDFPDRPSRRRDRKPRPDPWDRRKSPRVFEEDSLSLVDPAEMNVWITGRRFAVGRGDDGERSTMRRSEAVRSLRVVLACAATTAVAEEPPALTAPALSAPSEPIGELPPAIEAQTKA